LVEVGIVCTRIFERQALLKDRFWQKKYWKLEVCLAKKLSGEQLWMPKIREYRGLEDIENA
jgi:hypothetical protein